MGNPYRIEDLREAVPRYATPNDRVTEDEYGKRDYGEWFDAEGKFNPRVSKGSSDRYFSRSGELNAWDNEDALRRIASLLNDVKARKVFPFRVESRIPKKARNEIIAEALKDPVGFQLVGQLLAEPIKKIVDYESWSMKIWRVRTLAQGEPFQIPKDVDVVGWTVQADGQTVAAQLKGLYVYPDEFKVVSFIEVDLGDIARSMYDILARGQDRARQEVERQLDIASRNVLDKAALTVNSVTVFAALNVNVFEDIRYQVERHGLVVDKFLINRQELSDIIKVMSTQVDFVTQRELILAGYIGNILNAMIITSAFTGVYEVIKPGEIFAVTEGGFLGELGERIPIQAEDYRTFVRGDLKRGWAIYGQYGIGVGNPKAVAKGTK